MEVRRRKQGGGTDMLTIIPQFAIGATGLMALFLLLSGLALLIVILASLFYIVSVNRAGTSLAIDAGLAVFAFVVSKLWTTSMLQMVALYNGVGGGAASAAAAADLFGNKTEGATRLAVTVMAALIGAVSLSGSLVAWTKLNGVIDTAPWAKGQQGFSLLVMLTALVIGGYIVYTANGGADRLIGTPGLVCLFFGCALLFGALLTLPFGRSEMPVVISIYNAVAGLAVGLEGFVLRSPTMMIGAVVIGTARILLTLRMAKRSAADTSVRRTSPGLRAIE
jgi:H+-translocating NAD(P) transhydrogenase subunit beta